MFRAFNMGVGMVVATDEAGGAAVSASAKRLGVDAWQVGTLVPGTGRVYLSSGD
jgi:phosphoribosylaminoimidazole (AIR) synthetase